MASQLLSSYCGMGCIDAGDPAINRVETVRGGGRERDRGERGVLVNYLAVVPACDEGYD